MVDFTYLQWNQMSKAGNFVDLGSMVEMVNNSDSFFIVCAENDEG